MKVYIIFVILLAISHSFICGNLIYLFKINGYEQKMLILTTVILFIISVFAKPLSIHNLNPLTNFLKDFFYIWLGILWFLCVTFGVIDLFLLSVKVLKPQIGLFTPAYLKFFGCLAISLSTIIVVYATLNAKSATNLTAVDIKINSLPKSFNQLKIIQLSDLHIGDGQDGKWLEKVVKITNSYHPDIVAITGDLVDGSVENLKHELLPLTKLKTKYGVFFVTGNHEFYSGADEWCEYLKSLNIKVLRNQSQIITNDLNHHLAITGIEDHSANFIPGYSSDITKAIKNIDKNIPIILLAHQPKAVEEASKHGVKLQLSGHTHAGQIWPFNYLVKLQQPYVKGLHMHNDTALYINSGTGQWGPPMRFLTKTEITVITLRSD